VTKHLFHRKAALAALPLVYDRARIAFPGALQGVYSFTNLANFLAGKYSSRTRAVFDRYNIVPGSDLDDAMAKRAAYETQMSKRDRRANASKEPATFPSATPLHHVGNRREPTRPRECRYDGALRVAEGHPHATNGGPEAPSGSAGRATSGTPGSRRRRVSVALS
jgi:hypothetical protein